MPSHKFGLVRDWAFDGVPTNISIRQTYRLGNLLRCIKYVDFGGITQFSVYILIEKNESIQ